VVTAAPRIAIINGGAGGIGQAVVLRLAAENYLPVVLDINGAACDETMALLAANDLGGEIHVLDLTEVSRVREVVGQVASHHGRVDVLVNLAGGTLYQHPIEEFPIDEWRRVIDVNLKASFLCCQAVIPAMKSQRSGTIINTSSNYGVTGGATRTAYSAAKAAIIAFSKSLALELAGFGITVNTIAPGRTATPRVMAHYSAEAWAASSRSIPMGRSGEPTDIGEGVAFLVSGEAGYVTGQTLHINGGMVMP